MPWRGFFVAWRAPLRKRNVDRLCPYVECVHVATLAFCLHVYSEGVYRGPSDFSTGAEVKGRGRFLGSQSRIPKLTPDEKEREVLSLPS
jgi:hypothetical protein